MGINKQEKVQYECVEIGKAQQEALKVLMLEDIEASIRKISRRRRGSKSFGLLMGNKYIDENHVIVYVDQMIPIGSRFKDGKLSKAINRLSKKSNGKEIVGWYGAYADSGAMLKEKYQWIHRQFFGKPWHFIYLVDDKLNCTNIYYWHLGRLKRSIGYYQLVNDLNNDKGNMKQNNTVLEKYSSSSKPSDFVEENNSTVKFSDLIKKYENDRKLNSPKLVKRLYKSCALAVAALIIIVCLQYINSYIRRNGSFFVQTGDDAKTDESEIEEIAGQDNQELENLENAISDLKGRLESEKSEIGKQENDVVYNGDIQDREQNFDKADDVVEESLNPELEIISNDDLVIYVIQKGDTLSSICEKYYGDSSYKNILGKINRLDNYSYIRVGDYLIIPSKEQIDKLIK